MAPCIQYTVIFNLGICLLAVDVIPHWLNNPLGENATNSMIDHDIWMNGERTIELNEGIPSSHELFISIHRNGISPINATADALTHFNGPVLPMHAEDSANNAGYRWKTILTEESQNNINEGITTYNAAADWMNGEKTIQLNFVDKRADIILESHSLFTSRVREESVEAQNNERITASNANSSDDCREFDDDIDTIGYSYGPTSTPPSFNPYGIAYHNHLNGATLPMEDAGNDVGYRWKKISIEDKQDIDTSQIERERKWPQLQRDDHGLIYTFNQELTTSKDFNCAYSHSNVTMVCMNGEETNDAPTVLNSTPITFTQVRSLLPHKHTKQVQRRIENMTFESRVHYDQVIEGKAVCLLYNTIGDSLSYTEIIYK